MLRSMVSMQNEKVKLWKKLKQRKYRERERLYILEGPHLVQEALFSSPELISAILIDEAFHLPKDWPLETIEVYQVTHKIFTELSQTETPQGIIAVCQMVRPQITLKKGGYLLVDSVQDPGNLGTLIRTADAFGLQAVFLGDGCVDGYNGKTLRSAQGSHFHLPVIQRNLFDLATEMKHLGIPLYGSSLQGKDMTTVTVRDAAFGLVVGNEGHGASPELLAEMDEEVKIPMEGRAESMNVAVASGILLYWLQTGGLAHRG
ncbi:TrmH family RNA methyltransferase [Sporolactobacillus spathodeae]|uniref:TrmH family RNA methyltransferase n=1 Tax=Sporolactobacillus spathodeae TaxID=1465502 RepID=A0ABS2QAK2_9BACL|nr:RNA methyltransferase [Sporolactobacillus spathodeae]MBM7658753.1 TrmH family RNA methyltransferase [Sporolactobacillus spathodeae]